MIVFSFTSFFPECVSDRCNLLLSVNSTNLSRLVFRVHVRANEFILTLTLNMILVTNLWCKIYFVEE